MKVQVIQEFYREVGPQEYTQMRPGIILDMDNKEYQKYKPFLRNMEAPKTTTKKKTTTKEKK
jgi:hypothetical protein